MVTAQPGPTLPDAGEAAAGKAWRAFLDDDVDGYDRNRDRPDLDRTSRMSVYLKWGTLHPRTLLHDLSSRAEQGGGQLTAASSPGGSSTPTSCSTGRSP